MPNILKINKNFKKKNILSLDQFDLPTIELLFKETAKMKKGKFSASTLKGKVIALLFVEPSTRTFGSFASAVKRLGGQTVELQNPATASSMSKGETLEDSVNTLECYSDLIVMRHPEKGAAQRAAEALEIPLINAGDGVGEHPTQALLDLFTLYEFTGKLDGLKGVIVGDLLNGRTVHSLIKALSFYKKNTLYLLSPEKLKLSREEFKKFSKKITLIEIKSEKEIPKDADFWYWTRVQKERFSSLKEYEKIKHSFVLTTELLKEKGNKKMIIMHPLPRVGEIEVAVDKDPRAVYLDTQMKNGLFVRMALLKLILGK